MRTTRRRGLVVTLAIVLAAVALYAAAGFLLAPRLIEHQLATLAEERLGQKLTVQKVSVNPFAFSVEATGLRVGRPNGLPILSARRVYLDLDLFGSGFGRGWVLGEGQSEGLQILLESEKDGELNVAELARRWQQASPPSRPDGAPLRITIKHLLAADSMLSYRDVTDKTVTTQVLPIRIELEKVSTLPDREGHYTLSARIVGGGALTWRGNLTLRPLQSDGDLEFQNLQLATAWKFIREHVRLDEPEGTLSVAAHYQFHVEHNKPALSLTRLHAQANGVKVTREGSSAPMVALKTIDIRDGNFDLVRRSVVLPNVSLDEGHVSVFRDADGALNWNLRACTPGEASAAPDAQGKPQKAAGDWNIDVKELGVHDVALRYRDLHRRTPLDLQIAQLNGASGLTVSVGDEVNVRAQDLDVRLEKLRLPAETPTVQLAHVQVQGGYFDLAEQSLGAKQVTVDGGSVRVERGADGSLAVAQMFEGSAGPKPAPAGTPWHYAIDAARVQHVSVALSDRSFGETLAYPIDDVSLQLEHIASAGKKAMTFKVSAQAGKGGSVAANGTLAQNFSRADARVKLEGVALAPLQPLIDRYARVKLVSGKASASAELTYRADKGAPLLSMSGPFRIDNVRLNEGGTGTLVLAWKRLSSQQTRVTLGPDDLRIKQIVVEEPEMRIAISEKRELNLMQLLKHTTPAAASPRKPEPVSVSQTSRRGSSPFPVRIGEVRLRDGTMDYSDLSLVLPFATHVTNLAGAAVGLGTQPDRRATLDFDGDIGEFGSVKINGSVQPLSPTTFIDIAASFENVQMPELSPYTATFLGRKVASGKLWVDVKYRIDQGVLTGENDVTVHDLKLGEHVNTPTALKIPLDLAVALLTDANGVIHVAVPVKGNVNDPKFELGTVIREAFGNLIKRIVSAPFRALARLFGGKKGGEDDFGRIDFEPGSDKLMASEKEKLQNVAKVLDQRPQLKLTVQAPYSPQADRQAIKLERAAREVEQALGRKLRPDEKPAPVAFDSLAAQRALERLADEKAGSAATRDWVAQYAKRKGAEPERAGTILRRKGDPAFYAAMFAWIATIEPVPEAAMQNLAEKRAQAVLDTLQAAGVDPGRLEAGPAQSAQQEKEKRIGAELSLARAGTLAPAASPNSNVAAHEQDEER